MRFTAECNQSKSEKDKDFNIMVIRTLERIIFLSKFLNCTDCKNGSENRLHSIKIWPNEFVFRFALTAFSTLLTIIGYTCAF